MSVNNNSVEATRLRVRKALSVELENAKLKRGTYVWGKMKKVHWPGIVLNHKDVHLDEKKNHYIIFWFGDHSISHVSHMKVEPFAIHFNKNYKKKNKSSLWEKAIVECVTHYGYPYTAGLDNNALIKFANSTQLQKIALNTEDLPEFVKTILNSKGLHRKVHQNRAKKQSKIQYILPHILQSTCIVCLDTITDNGVPHPFYDANVCVLCARKLREVLYSFEDGAYEYCFICGNTKNYHCKNTSCKATFCNFCIKNYWKYSVADNLSFCALCSNLMQGLLKRSDKFMLKSLIFMLSNETKSFSDDLLPSKMPQINFTPENNINVLTLFYSSSKGIEVLFPIPFNTLFAIHCNNLNHAFGINNNKLSWLEVRKQAKKNLDNSFVRLVTMTTKVPIDRNIVQYHIEDLNRKKCKLIGNISLILGGTSISKTKLNHFKRSCLTSLFMEFWRVINLFIEEVNPKIKWLFEMPYNLDLEELNFITSYLQCEPRIIGSNQYYCYVWTNTDSSE